VLTGLAATPARRSEISALGWTPAPSRRTLKGRGEHRPLEQKRLYLRPGDPVHHLSRRVWGLGIVIECMTSQLEGGTALVRILFNDGKLRVFENDLDNGSCCYYFGVRHYTPGLEIDLFGVRPMQVALGEAVQALRALGPYKGPVPEEMEDAERGRRALDKRRVRSFQGRRPPDIRDLRVVDFPPDDDESERPLRRSRHDDRAARNPGRLTGRHKRS